jgi:hypothetical protein
MTSIKSSLVPNHMKKPDPSKKTLPKKKGAEELDSESFMDESFYSQMQEMDLLDDYQGVHKRAPTMNFIPNIEKSMDMLSQSTM